MPAPWSRKAQKADPSVEQRSQSDVSLALLISGQGRVGLCDIGQVHGVLSGRHLGADSAGSDVDGDGTDGETAPPMTSPGVEEPLAGLRRTRRRPRLRAGAHRRTR